MNRLLIGLFAVAVAMTTYIFWRGTPASSAPPASSTHTEAPAAVEATGSDAGVLSTEDVTAQKPAAQPGTPEATGRTVRELAPSREDLRQEVAKNPHDTPVSLLSFSAGLYERTAAALQDPAAAETLFEELQDCVTGTDQKGKTSVQAICMLNARRLHEKHESLSRRYENLERQADPKILDLMQGL